MTPSPKIQKKRSHKKWRKTRCRPHTSKQPRAGIPGMCRGRPVLSVPLMSGPSVYGSEPSAAAVFACLRALVTTQAAAHTVWQDFAVAFLAPETEAFIAARLSAAEVGGGDDSAPPSKKKRKRAGGAEAAEGEAKILKTCDHCHGDIPEVTLRVAMLDGTTFSVTVPERGCVREVKREIAKVQQGSAAVLPAAARCGASITRSLICVAHCVRSRKASPSG